MSPPSATLFSFQAAISLKQSSLCPCRVVAAPDPAAAAAVAARGQAQLGALRCAATAVQLPAGPPLVFWLHLSATPCSSDPPSLPFIHSPGYAPPAASQSETSCRTWPSAPSSGPSSRCPPPSSSPAEQPAIRQHWRRHPAVWRPPAVPPAGWACSSSPAGAGLHRVLAPGGPAALSVH